MIAYSLSLFGTRAYLLRRARLVTAMAMVTRFIWQSRLLLGAAQLHVEYFSLSVGLEGLIPMKIPARRLARVFAFASVAYRVAVIARWEHFRLLFVWYYR
jgi:hypothetical protein